MSASAQIPRKGEHCGSEPLKPGAQVASTIRDYAKRAQTAMREQRETSFKTAHLLTQNFATLASGILIGMSEGLGAKRAASKGKTKKAKGRKIAKAAKGATATSAKRATAKTTRRPKTAKRAKTTVARKSS